MQKPLCTINTIGSSTIPTLGSSMLEPFWCIIYKLRECAVTIITWPSLYWVQCVWRRLECAARTLWLRKPFVLCTIIFLQRMKSKVAHFSGWHHSKQGHHFFQMSVGNECHLRCCLGCDTEGRCFQIVRSFIPQPQDSSMVNHVATSRYNNKDDFIAS
jgi:hypothetical protein